MSALLRLTLSLAPLEEPPPEPPPADEAPAEAPPAAAPLDDEVPEPAGIGREHRVYRQVEALVDRDLSGAWESYEDRVKDGSTESFVTYVGRRFRIRRNIGIGVIAWGVAALGVATYFWVETARADCSGVLLPCAEPVGLGVAAGATTVVSIGAIVTGAILWRRFGVALRELKDAGLARRPTVAPLVLRRGGGLGLSFAF